MSLNVKEKDLESESNFEDSSNENDISEHSHVDSEISTFDNKAESDPPRIQFKNTLRSKMYIIFRELYFLILIVLTYAAFQNSTPKVSKSPKAYPFFPQGSSVKDYFNGDLSEAIEFASQSDLAFVMYYAPWDAESQSVKHEFNLAAQHMNANIHFAAINCWQPNSECRQQYSKVYNWPVLMAYPTHGRGIQYRGIKKHVHMIKFLQLVSYPFKRITKLTEISQYQTSHDAVVVGFVDAKLGNNDFGIFYSAALRFLERDPFREVQFLIYTENIPNVRYPILQLYLWNETLIYPESSEWKPEIINTWISENLHQVSLWATLPGTKSTTLASYLTPGPALVLFTPRNPLYRHIDYYSVLHGVALDYYNCENNLAISLQKTYLELLRKDYNNEHKTLENKCLQHKKIKKQSFPTVVTYDLNKIWMNNSCNDNKQRPMQNFCYGKKLNKNTCSNIITTSEIKLNRGENKIDIKEIDETLVENKLDDNIYSTVIYTDKNDPKSPENLQKLHQKEKCYYFRLGNKLRPAHFAPLNSTEANSFNISGMACKTNISLSILALDTFEYHHFAESLGIDILNLPDRSATVILNPNLETHHVMQNEFSGENVNKFILDFTKGKLDRSLSSQFSLRLNSHFYEFKGAGLYNGINQNIHLIQELNSYNFLSTIMQPNTAVIVMYYSTKCGFCSGVSHMLLETSKILSTVKELKFARIDGDNQGLPWEFSMHHFPSILYFPPKRKSESRVFPQNVPITVPNLLAFVIANVDSNIKLKVMWNICNQTKFNDEIQKCIKTVRNESMTLIGKMLRLYRFTHDVQHRTLLLKQLQNLRSLHFALSSNYLNIKQINKYINLLRILDMTPNKLKRENLL